MNQTKARTAATGGVLLALSLVTLYGATFIPGIELTLYAISSFYIAFVIIEISVSAGFLFYIASVLLAFILIPDKIGLIPYALFFGLYGIIKLLIERLKKLPQPIEILIKLIFCNTMLILGFHLFGELFLGNIQVPDIALPVILIGAQVFFLAYDYIYTLVIGFYLKRRPKA
ncbi:MAG: hypothetical protein PHV71_07575 [Eubacteriales bacterium]|nr:hypothetical protein [Eubacteriales bacterium]MDD3199920.1 hypothetical protein [Eubacteriales bacterium]MDD4122508.1 hypothetical protein [Eubacteriales bacterium]MDD4630429.1 hypothetical protein [Eubacteriales bacterium]